MDDPYTQAFEIKFPFGGTLDVWPVSRLWQTIPLGLCTSHPSMGI